MTGGESGSSNDHDHVQILVERRTTLHHAAVAIAHQVVVSPAKPRAKAKPFKPWLYEPSQGSGGGAAVGEGKRGHAIHFHGKLVSLVLF